MSKYKTIDVWNRVFGARQEAYDYTGRLMKKSACGNPNSAYHPTLDHIRPLSAGGCDDGWNHSQGIRIHADDTAIHCGIADMPVDIIKAGADIPNGTTLIQRLPIFAEERRGIAF